MNRKICCQNELVSLAETNDSDYEICYNDWLDADTQKGYNYRFSKSFEEYRGQDPPPLPLPQNTPLKILI
jgi:hypothetical protein